MQWADSCILMPCGRSAHIEGGYFRCANKRFVIPLSEGEPELMCKMADAIALAVPEAVAALSANVACTYRDGAAAEFRLNARLLLCFDLPP